MTRLSPVQRRALTLLARPGVNGVTERSLNARTAFVDGLVDDGRS